MRALLLLMLMAAAAGAQTIEVESLFQPASLAGMWKRQVGDDPRWADPAFDDSGWPSVRVPDEGCAVINGYSWYRFRVRLPGNRPAAEVGGDFCRILPANDGAILVVVGDVSGKGLRAAMTASGLTCAMEVIRTRRPGAFLAELDRAAAAHLQSGFATCCAALIQPNGEAVIANAGHPAPYCDGKELVLEGGLPLGIAPEGDYLETIARGEQFTFVSDGVVEAENPQRELFGFERTREISTQSAREIAEAAQVWGQNDDITVVTVRRYA